MATKKAPSNTAQSAVKAMLNAALPEFECPAHVKLRPKDQPFWSAIMASRAREEWAKIDFVVAAQLARCQADIEYETEILEREGSVIENFRGTPVMNPRHSVLEQLARKELALMRSLGLTGSASRGNKEDVEKARKVQRQASAARDELQEDDLLAS
jgi:hypothetical protein